MTTSQILAELRSLGTERYKKTIMTNHGVREPCFGVKISDLKKIQKRVKTNHDLGLSLYDSGNYDAMYLAGLIVDDARMTQEDLQRWAENAYGGALAGATVAWVAAEGPHGWEMGLKWIDSTEEHIAKAGWSTLASVVALKPDSDLKLPALKRLLARIEKTIHDAPGSVRYAMNELIIAIGCHVASLAEDALRSAESIGPITANLGRNQCTVPSATEHIHNAQRSGALGKKRKTVKC